MSKKETTFIEDFKVAMDDNPTDYDQAIQFARTRAWYFVVQKGLVDTPSESAYTNKCIVEAKKKWKHLK